MISELAKKSHEIRLQDSKVQTHPCYSKDAHKYARIHLPVAPGVQHSVQLLQPKIRLQQ